jgi:hypothetical protein
MNPLLAVAASLLPELLKLVAGDKTGNMATKIAGTVSAATKTDDPVQAKSRIDSDPKLASDLQISLAQIALDYHRAALATGDRNRRSDVTAEPSKMPAPTPVAPEKSTIASDGGARAFLLDMIKANNPLTQPLAWTPSVLSYLIVAGFFGIVGILLAWPEHLGQSSSPNSGVLQIVNICVGALAAAFATVTNYWLGSSLGSRNKDNAIAATNSVLAAANSISQTSPSQSPGPTAPQPAPHVESGAVQFGSLVPGGYFSSDPNNLSLKRSIRTNNPGALNISKWQQSRLGYAGMTQPDGSADHNVTTIYRTPEHGIAAWYHLLSKIYTLTAGFTLSDLARCYAGGDAAQSSIDAYVQGWAHYSQGSMCVM